MEWIQRAHEDRVKSARRRGGHMAGGQAWDDKGGAQPAARLPFCRTPLSV